MNLILQLDSSGLPKHWLSKEDAAVLYCKSKIQWEIGEQRFVMRGGYDKRGLRSSLVLSSMIATKGKPNKQLSNSPPLTNGFLFRRDNNLCMYCGQTKHSSLLTRDHVVPRVQGGKDRWTNVVAACKRCNNLKGGRTPEQAGMALLAVPFEPNIFEFMYLANRRILADQMEYLRSRFSGKRKW